MPLLPDPSYRKGRIGAKLYFHSLDQKSPATEAAPLELQIRHSYVDETKYHEDIDVIEMIK